VLVTKRNIHTSASDVTDSHTVTDSQKQLKSKRVKDIKR
jgi:hypothetical protein